MNQVLQNRYNELGREELQQLRFRLKDSPKGLKLLDLLDKRRERKFNTVDAVDFLYEKEEESFEVLRNRFFKLRKQMLGLFETSPASATATGFQLLPLEEKLYKCRQLVTENHFQIARNELRALVQECREQNVFEILPEATGQLIYCNLAMNVLKENEKLTDELDEASALLHDFRHMQVLARKIYYAVVSYKTDDAMSLLLQMRRLTSRRESWPRFRLFYHFTYFTHTASLPGLGTKSAARHLTAVKNILAKHPGLPAGNYEPNAPAIMQFYLAVGEGTQLYMKGNAQGCYKLFREAWDIMERTPNLRVRKSESHFTNKIAIEVATGRYRDALKTAEELIDFQKEQRQEEKRLKGYAEIATIYSYAWPNLKCPNADFISKQLKRYVEILRKNDSPLVRNALSTQAIFAFLCGDWKKANKLIADAGTQSIFAELGLAIYSKILALHPGVSQAAIDSIRGEIDKQLYQAVSADRVFSLKRAQALVKIFEDAQLA